MIRCGRKRPNKAALQFVHHLDLADNSSRTAKFSIDAQVPCIRFKVFNVPFQGKNHVTFHKPDVWIEGPCCAFYIHDF